MKKTLVMVITVITIIALAACSKKEENNAEATPTAVVQQEDKTEATPTAEPTQAPTEAPVAATDATADAADTVDTANAAADAETAIPTDEENDGDADVIFLEPEADPETGEAVEGTDGVYPLDGDGSIAPEGNDNSGENETTESFFNSEIMSIFTGNGEFRLFTPEEQEQIIADAREYDANVEFGEDGTITITQISNPSVVMIARPDGSMYATMDGNEIVMSVGGEWPEAATAAGIPVAPFEVTRSVVMGSNISMEFAGVDYAAAYEYGQAIKEAGFVIGEDGETTYEEYGMYCLEGKDANGYWIAFYFMGDETETLCALTLTEDTGDEDGSADSDEPDGPLDYDDIVELDENDVLDDDAYITE